MIDQVTQEVDRMEHSNTIDKLSASLCKAQKNFKTAIKKCINPYYHSKYADYSEILSCVKPALNNEGISILQPIKEDFVETILLHESGEWMSSLTKIYCISNKPQDYGSAITYARRYGLSSILAIDSDDDDDGNTANGNNILKKNDQPQKQPNIGANNSAELLDLRKRVSELYQHNVTQVEIEAFLGFPLKDLPQNLDKAKEKISLIEKEVL